MKSEKNVILFVVDVAQIIYTIIRVMVVICTPKVVATTGNPNQLASSLEQTPGVIMNCSSGELKNVKIKLRQIGLEPTSINFEFIVLPVTLQALNKHKGSTNRLTVCIFDLGWS